MYLEIVNGLLENWKNPNYEGFRGWDAPFPYLTKNIESQKNFKTLLDIENSKYTFLNNNKPESYDSDYDGLLKFYADFNIKPAWARNNTVVTYHKLMNTTYDMTYEMLSKYIDPNAEYLLELGFTGGFMSNMFINNTSSHIMSIDKMFRDYHYLGKNYLDAKYPGRHTLFVGAPKHIAKILEEEYDNVKFGTIYINKSRTGDHIYNYFHYLKELTDENTIVILRNTTPHQGWGVNTYIAMTKLIAEGVLLFVDHVHTDAQYFGTFAVLKYNFKKGYVQKLSTEQYVRLEYMVLYNNFAMFLKSPDESDIEKVNKEFVENYRNKFKEYGLDFTDEIKTVLKDKFDIIIE